MKFVTLILSLVCYLTTGFCYFTECTHSMCFFAFLTLLFTMEVNHSDIIDKMKGE